MVETTPEEDKAIRALQRVADNWPDSLWLYSASGTLCVMKKNSDGTKQYISEGHDPTCVVGEIDIENDGGDW